jgi:hypothetical protein
MPAQAFQIARRTSLSGTDGFVLKIKKAFGPFFRVKTS